MSEPTERFLLFGGDTHYSSGGFGSFLSSHDSTDAAIREAQRRLAWDWPEDYFEDYMYRETIEWYHVFDCELRVVVARSQYQSFGNNTDALAKDTQPLPLSTDTVIIAEVNKEP